LWFDSLYFAIAIVAEFKLGAVAIDPEFELGAIVIVVEFNSNSAV